MNDKQFLLWIHERLEVVHEENPNQDFMHRLKAIANQTPEGARSTNISHVNDLPTYSPTYLSWCKSYDDEVKDMRELILADPSDIKQLKQEYYLLTGTKFKKRKGE